MKLPNVAILRGKNALRAGGALIITGFLITGIFYFLKMSGEGSREILVEYSGEEKQAEEAPLYPQNAITGIECENGGHRPYAVMLAADAPTRPLSGIAAADLVVEMPVITGSITRMMGFYICERPEEIGSVRSSRHDFIPIAASFDAIYAHWGGSHYALDMLRQGVIDNIDALVNPYNVFYRKNWLPSPNNGFTSWERLDSTAKKLGYRREHRFSGYARKEIPNSPPTGQAGKSQTITINYAWPFTVEWKYNAEEGKYYRWRGGTKETDRLDERQVEASVIAVMRAGMRQIEGQYNDVDVEGAGEAIIFQNGGSAEGTWEKAKTSISSKLYFYDTDGEEMKFVRGKIWIEIVAPDTELRIENFE